MKSVITTAHGTGGRSTHELIEQHFLPHLKNEMLSPHDAAQVALSGQQLMVTTDSHVVEPILFPGGDIGKLAITGVINDLLTRGGRPLYLSLGFILEEGLPLADLKTILKSMAGVMADHGIRLLCADTKVVPPRGTPGLMISSTLFGEPLNPDFSPEGAKPGDTLIVTAPLGSHGLSLLQARESLPFRTTISSDCASLFPLLSPLVLENEDLHYMRDLTRGGLAGVLHELSKQYAVSFELNESEIPVRPEVRAGLALLGIDPLEVANEGVMLLIVPAAKSPRILERLRSHPLGQNSVAIGTVLTKARVPLVLRTPVGGQRVLPWPEALNLPRIC